MNIVPDLAKSWEIADETTYVFYLHKGIMFHDGTECTAEDVKFSIERIIDPKTASPGRDKFVLISEIVAIDPYTVKIKTEKPFAPFMSYLTNTRNRAQIVSKKAVEKYGTEFGMHPVGTGPFVFKEWRPGATVEVERFDQYFKKNLPYLKGISFPHIPEGTSGINALKAGDIHAANAVPPAMVTEVEGVKGIKFFRTPGLNYRFIMFNHSKKPFDDQKVRLAFAKSINRKELIDAVYFGDATVSRGPIPPSIKWAYDPTLDVQSYDPKAANDLLKQSKYSKDELRKMNIVLEGFGSGWWKRFAEVAAYQISKTLGMDINVSISEFGSLFERIKKGSYAFVVWGILGAVEVDEYLYENYASGSAKNILYKRHYSNKEVDALLEQGRTEFDLKKRKEIYKKAQRLIVEDAADIYCFHANILQAVVERLEGYIQTPFNGYGAEFEAAYLKA
jgi:peptide/nickel transport system substrate-binding protein